MIFFVFYVHTELAYCKECAQITYLHLFFNNDSYMNVLEHLFILRK